MGSTNVNWNLRNIVAKNFPKLAQIALLILSISVVCFITVFRSPYFLRGFQASHYTGQKSSFSNNRGHVLGQPAVELRLRVDVVEVPQLGLGLLLAAGLVDPWNVPQLDITLSLVHSTC